METYGHFRVSIAIPEAGTSSFDASGKKTCAPKVLEKRDEMLRKILTKIYHYT